MMTVPTSPAASSTFEIGPVLLAVKGDIARQRDLEARMDPLRPLPNVERHPDVEVSIMQPDDARPRFEDVLNPSRDGTVTASDGTRAYVLSHDAWCSLPSPLDGVLKIECSHDFPAAMLLGLVLRPAIQIAMLGHRACAVHSAAAAFGEKGVLIAGWSETGKTETVLALGEEGASFVSDKWTCLDAERRLSPFPISVGIRRWVVPYLPTLRSRLPRAARMQLWAAGLVDSLLQPVRKVPGRGAVWGHAVDVLDRVAALADRAALRQSALQKIYGGERAVGDVPRLELLVLLSTGSAGQVSIQQVDARFAARRLARSASYERRPFFDLQERAHYSLPDTDAEARRTTMAREEAILVSTLAPVIILNARTPFPVDPRRVTDALSPWL